MIYPEGHTGFNKTKSKKMKTSLTRGLFYIRHTAVKYHSDNIRALLTVGVVHREVTAAGRPAQFHSVPAFYVFDPAAAYPVLQLHLHHSAAHLLPAWCLGQNRAQNTITHVIIFRSEDFNAKETNDD